MSQNLRGPSAQLNSLPVNQRLGVLYTVGRNTSARKQTTSTVNNSAALVADPELGIYLGTAPKNGFYFRLCAQLAIAAAANNIRYAFFGPDGLALLAASTRWYGQLLLTGVVPQVDPNQGVLNGAITGGVTNAWTNLIVEGVVQPESPGFFGFAFAQNVAGATNTQVLAGSSLFAIEIAP